MCDQMGRMIVYLGGQALGGFFFLFLFFCLPQLLSLTRDDDFTKQIPYTTVRHGFKGHAGDMWAATSL